MATQDQALGCVSRGQVYVVAYSLREVSPLMARQRPGA
jgi:hypothetical protein